MSDYTPGRFVVAWVGADGARDPIMLTSQVKMMRDGFERLGHRPALLLIVVADGEEDAASSLVRGVLGIASTTSDRAPAVAPSAPAGGDPGTGETPR